MTLSESHFLGSKTQHIWIMSGIIWTWWGLNCSKGPSSCIFTGQTAGSSGQAMGGSPGYSAVPPRVGPQGPGAPRCLTSGPALCGVGEDGHHHPSGGPGHHRPADRGLRGRTGASHVTRFHLGQLFWFGMVSNMDSAGKPRKAESWAQNQSLQPSTRARREVVRV